MRRYNELKYMKPLEEASYILGTLLIINVLINAC